VSPRPSLVLRATFAQAEPILHRSAAGLWDAGFDRGYGGYLATMYQILRASVPLMELAARRCARLGAGDPVAAGLRGYFAGHIAEEAGHDAWLLDDLATLGHRRAGEPDLPPPVVARLVGAQYYWVEHHHPVTLLGYIAVLEANAPSPRLADRLVAAGVPEAAVRTVREHAELDTGHIDALYAFLDGLPLTAGQVRAVAVSGLHTAGALADVFVHVRRDTVAGDR
jgi:hypothetical protein